MAELFLHRGPHDTRPPICLFRSLGTRSVAELRADGRDGILPSTNRHLELCHLGEEGPSVFGRKSAGRSKLYTGETAENIFHGVFLEELLATRCSNVLGTNQQLHASRPSSGAMLGLLVLSLSYPMLDRHMAPYANASLGVVGCVFVCLAPQQKRRVNLKPTQRHIAIPSTLRTPLHVHASCPSIWRPLLVPELNHMRFQKSIALHHTLISILHV